MKYFILTVLSMLLLSGCAGPGISREEYNRVIAENESLQNEISELRSEHESLLDLMNSPTEEKVQNAKASVFFRDEECFGEYSGAMTNDKPSGSGRFISDDGWEYSGELKDGFLAGEGTVAFESGTVLKGTFEKGWLRSGIISDNGVGIQVDNGQVDPESVLMSMIRGIEKGEEESFKTEPMSKYSHRIDSVKPAYDYIEEHLSDFLNADASDEFLTDNSQSLDLSSFYKDVTRYGSGSWNWSGWKITGIRTDPADAFGLEYKICSISMEKGPEHFLHGYIIGDNIDSVIDSINIGDSIAFNAIPIYSMVVGLDSENWHDDAVIIAKILEHE